MSNIPIDQVEAGAYCHTKVVINDSNAIKFHIYFF